MGAEGALSAAARAYSSRSSLSRSDEGAARQGRRSERAPAEEGLVLAATTSTCPGVDEIGATPFWRAAYASDVDAMKLLVAHGADPYIPTIEAGRRVRATRRRERARPDDAVAAAAGAGRAVPACRRCRRRPASGYGEGFAANSHRFAPSGMLAAVKYLVEELGADVNAAITRATPRCTTPPRAATTR